MSPDRRRRGPLLVLAAVGMLLGLGATPRVQAQAPTPDVDQFGGFEARARSNALTLTYDQTGLVPVGPVFQLSVPEAVSTITSGPTGYALSSLVYPGPLIADLGAALAAGGTETPIPPYPVRSEAFFPSGPTETVSGGGGATMSSRTDFADSRAESTFVDIGVAPVVSIGNITAASRTTIEGDSVVSRTRTEVGDITLLGGLIHIESIVTDLVARSTGESAGSDGVTTVGGAALLGLPITIDGTGIHFVTDDGGEPGDGSIEVVPGVTIPDPGLGAALGGTLAGVVEPLNDLLAQVGAAGGDALMQLFEATGIEIRLAPVDEVISGASALREANGLEISINYDGNNTPVITDLLALIPNDLLPDDNLGPVPLTPAGLFNMLKQTHLISFALAPASVRAIASPSFVVDIPPFESSTSPVVPAPPAPAPLTPSFSDNFDTALPPVGGSPDVVTAPVSSPSSLALGLAIPALMIFAVILGAPFFAAGSSKLADATLAGTGMRCPDGLDQPPSSPGAP